MQIQGTLRHVNLEGGFWTLQGDDDVVYNLGRLEQSVTTTRLADGRRVEIEGEIDEGGFGIHMHGTPITVTACKDAI